jgi:two-component system chemotaxis response regulator CheB
MTIRILLVDDSEVVRLLFSKALERDPQLRVVAVAGNGFEAIEMAKKHKPDVVLLDIEMPKMDGRTALPEILKHSPSSKVFIVSSNEQTPEESLEALQHGAIDVFVKPGGNNHAAQAFYSGLRDKLKAAAGDGTEAPATSQPPKLVETAALPASTPKLKPVTYLMRAPPPAPAAPQPPAPAKVYALQRPGNTAVRAIAIASSTGGPEALRVVLQGLSETSLAVPIFITQHMPPKFTVALAEQLARYAGRDCHEAIDGEAVKPGILYLAPGGHHLTVRIENKHPVIRLTQDAPVNSCRPSADPMFSSLSHIYGTALLAVVLTGIGNDGLMGARAVRANGGTVIAQDRATSAVYGMPRMVAEADICEAVLPLGDIASYIKPKLLKL